MNDNFPSWSGKRIMDRWGISPTELAAYIYRGLPAYEMRKGKFIEVPPKEINSFGFDRMTDLVFYPSDIEAFEKEYGLSPLQAFNSGKFKLSETDDQVLDIYSKDENEELNIVTNAAIQMALLCKDRGEPVSREEFGSMIIKIRPEVPSFMVPYIWLVLPNEFKKPKEKIKESSNMEKIKPKIQKIDAQLVDLGGHASEEYFELNSEGDLYPMNCYLDKVDISDLRPGIIYTFWTLFKELVVIEITDGNEVPVEEKRRRILRRIK